MVIPGNKKLSSNLDMAKRRMLTRRGFLVVALVLTGLILTACENSPKTMTPIVTSQSGITETMPANETPEVEQTHFVEMNRGVENERLVEIMKQVDLFSKEESPYTELDVELNMFKLYGWKGDVELGILNAYEDELGLVEIQGMLIGNIETSDAVVVFLGVQDKEGNRFVTPIKIYDILYNLPLTENNVVGFRFVRSSKDLKVDWENVIIIDDKKELVTRLNENQGEVVAFQQFLKKDPPLTDELINQLLQAGYVDPELTVKQIMELRDNTREATKNLVLNLWCQSLENLGSTGTINTIDNYGNSEGNPIIISNIENIIEVVESNNWMPTSLLGYYQ